MLQKYFPLLAEVNSPLAAMAALQFTAEAATIAVAGISNEVFESLLKDAVEETSARKQEVVVAASEIEAARVTAAKELRTLRYRAAMAARSARKISKLSRRIKAVRKPITSKSSLKGLSGLSINFCRSNAADAQKAVHSAVNSYNAALEAVETAINKGGDIKTIRSSVAALKAVVRELEVAHLNFRFAREMLSISLARHSA